MSLDVRIYPERKLVWVTGQNVVTDDDLAGYVSEYLVGAGLRTFDEVFDLSRADLLDLTYAGLAEVAAAAAPTDPAGSPTKIAILVGGALGMGVSRMYQNLREVKGGRRALRIFWALDELLAWMELPPGFDPLES